MEFNGSRIQKRLFELRDAKYAAFQAPLIPGLDPGRIIGVRTPALRVYAKELVRGAKSGDENMHKELEEFLAELPHRYFDEMQLHAFII